MPSWRNSERPPRLSRNSYHLPGRNPYRGNLLMTLAMIGVTIWSCSDGNRTVAMMVVASVGTVAAYNVLANLFGLIKPTRFIVALWSGSLVAVFMPIWDWLSARWLYPESVWTGLGFGVVFGLIRFALSPRGPSRPPS